MRKLPFFWRGRHDTQRIENLRHALTWLMEHPGKMQYDTAWVQIYIARELDWDEAVEMDRLFEESAARDEARVW